MASTVVEEKRPWLTPVLRATAIVLSFVGSFALVWVTFIILTPDAGGLAIMGATFRIGQCFSLPVLVGSTGHPTSIHCWNVSSILPDISRNLT